MSRRPPISTLFPHTTLSRPPDAGAASRWKGKVDWYLVMDESEGDAPMTFQQPQQSQQPNIPAFLLNWRTSAAGAVPILLALADLLNQLTSGHLDPNHLYADLGAISMGLGLVGGRDGRKERGQTANPTRGCRASTDLDPRGDRQPHGDGQFLHG